MTVSAPNTTSGPFVADGVTTSFPFTFKAQEGADVRVAVVDDNGVEVSAYSEADYSVSVEDDMGGTVLFETPPSGVNILLSLDPSFTQEIAFPNYGAWEPEAVEGGLDRSAMRDLALKDGVDRSLKAPRGVVMGELPPPAELAGKVVGFANDGVTPVAVDPIMLSKVIVAQANDGETYYARLIDGLIVGNIIVAAEAEAAMAAIQALGGGVLKFPVNWNLTPDADAIDVPDGVDIGGCGKHRTRIKRRVAGANVMADNGMFRSTGLGPRAWRTVGNDVAAGDKLITGIAGDISDMDDETEIMIRSTEWNALHIYDQLHSDWSAGEVVAKGEHRGFPIDNRTYVWAVATVGGMTAGAQPVITPSSYAPVVDGGVTWVWSNVTDHTEQNAWASGGAVAGPGRIYVTVSGHIYISLNPGVFSAVMPSATTSDFVNGTVHLSFAGYYNASKGEIVRRGEIVSAAGGVVTLTRGLMLDYPQDYPSGATFTVEVSVIDRNKIALRDICIEGSGLPANIGVDDGLGTWSAPVTADKGLYATWCDVETENVRWKKLDYFTVHLVLSDLDSRHDYYRHSPRRLDSQQYCVFQQGAGRSNFLKPTFINSRHGWDGDGSTPSFAAGIPEGCQSDGGRCAGVWQTPFSGHRDCGPIFVSNFQGYILAEGIKMRSPEASYTNCTFWSPTVPVFFGPVIALFYYGGKLTLNNVKIYGGQSGLGTLDSDTSDSMLELVGDVQIHDATDHSVRIGARKADFFKRFSLAVVSVNPGQDHVLLDGPCEQVTFRSLDLTGGGAGRCGIRNTNRETPADGLVIGPINARGLNGPVYELTKLTGSVHIMGGVAETSEDNVCCDITDCENVTIGMHTLTCSAPGFTGNGWRVRSSGVGDSAMISMAQQVVNVLDEGGGGSTGVVVEAGVRTSHFGFVTTNATTAIDKQAVDASVSYDNP